MPHNVLTTRSYHDGAAIKKTASKPLPERFKHSQTHCAHCFKLLDRITLVRRGQIVNKIAIARLDTLWMKPSGSRRKRVGGAVPFCGDLHCKEQSDFFDIIGFKQFLFEQTEMSHGTVREYVVRLRRLGNHLTEQNISRDLLQEGFLDENLAPWLPETSTNNYRIAYVSMSNLKPIRIWGICRNPPGQPVLIYIKNE
jgi:FliZ protein